MLYEVITDIFGATIHFVHVNSSDKAVFPEDTDVYRSMMKIIERNNKHSFESIHSKNIALALTDYVAENNIDVLVTIKHELGIWDKLFVITSYSIHYTKLYECACNH